MFKLGIISSSDYRPDRRTRWRRRVSWQLLRFTGPPSAKQVALFEEVVRELQLSSGVFRTTFRNRFGGLDERVNSQLARLFPSSAALTIEDWAASDCLTSSEWAALLARVFPNAAVHASDWTLYLIEAVNGRESFIVEPDGHLLQAVRPPFVLCCHPPEPWFLPMNRYLMRAASRRWNEIRMRLGPLPDWSDCDSIEECSRPPFELRRIGLVHPEAEAMKRSSPRFSIRRHSVFDALEQPCEVIRSMNIFNLSYFSRERLREGVETVFRSLVPEGVWIVGRTISDSPQEHEASILIKRGESFQVLERIGRQGSEIEEIALSRGR